MWHLSQLSSHSFLLYDHQHLRRMRFAVDSLTTTPATYTIHVVHLLAGFHKGCVARSRGAIVAQGVDRWSCLRENHMTGSSLLGAWYGVLKPM